MVFEGYRIFNSVLGLIVYLLVISGPADIMQKKVRSFAGHRTKQENPTPRQGLQCSTHYRVHQFLSEPTLGMTSWPTRKLLCQDNTR